MSNIKLFESKKIRSTWNDKDNKWYFSVADVVGALTDSAAPKAYWRQLKHREPELVTNCHGLKMTSDDGKKVEGGAVAGSARLDLEKKSGRRVSTRENFKAIPEAVKRKKIAKVEE